jgi:tripartite-type tricarboxylate transporter receptor subunit TctC
LRRVNAEIGEILREPEVLKRFEVFGYATSGPVSPESVEEHIRADRIFWTDLTKELGLQPK